MQKWLKNSKNTMQKQQQKLSDGPPIYRRWSRKTSCGRTKKKSIPSRSDKTN
jgi:hypothetical protein